MAYQVPRSDITDAPSGVVCEVHFANNGKDGEVTLNFTVPSGPAIQIEAEAYAKGFVPTRKTFLILGSATVDIEIVLCSYAISPTSKSVPITGGTYDIIVTPLINECETPWSVSESVNWIVITSGSSGNGDGTVSYEVLENNGPERTATITVAEKNYTVTQAGNNPPIISDAAWELIQLNDPICNLYGDTLGSSFLITFDYSDSDGNGPVNITQAKGECLLQGFSDCCDGGFNNYTWNSSLIGDGYSGTATTKQCYQFGNNNYVDVTMTIEDLIGSRSNPLTIRIPKPTALENDSCIPAILHLLLD